MYDEALLFVSAALCSISATAFADETLKYMIVYHPTDVQSEDVRDTNRHVVSLIRTSELALTPDGSVAICGFVGTLDYVKGAGTYAIYEQITFSDGAVLFTNGSGVATPDATKTTFKGTTTVIGGKRRGRG
jgi:hypothetical protein